MRKLWTCLALLAFVLVMAGCKVVVTPDDPQSWGFLNEGANGNGYFVNGPGDPPAGRGSAVLAIDGNGREAIASLQYAGTMLNTLSQLRYSTYQAFSGSPNETLYLGFDVDYDSTDSSTAYQGRLVYVPQMAGTVTPKTWQEWDTLTGGAAWYSTGSGASSFRPIVGDAPQASPPCTQTTFCTWSTVLGHYPNARIRPTTGVLLIRAGGPVTGGFVGATDNLVLQIGSVLVENDFEPGDGHVAVTAANAAGRGFGFVTETNNGTGSFVSGPSGKDGAGSAKLTIDSTGAVALANGLFAGTSLDDFTFLSYKTYTQNASTHATTLQLDVDYDSTDATTAFQGRAVFEPSVSGQAAIAADTWQTWNPLTAPSGWWQTGNAIVAGGNVGQACTQAVPCSFAQLLAAYPNASVRPVTGQSQGQPIGGGMYLKAGSGWSGGYTGNVDSLTVAVNIGGTNGTVTYDLEP
ncbi:MAG TPA: hypothetical protein VFX21_00750 [Acidimicrobiia bacterium]|nr:hypothetical protein [Acidimicrobiia bacterium]